MNFVSFSPQFPPTFRAFWTQLSLLGANVLGLADAAYDELHPDLRNALTEYYRVQNAHNYDELVRAMGYFTHRYGKIDRLESHNEYWLETEARIRNHLGALLRANQVVVMGDRLRLHQLTVEVTDGCSGVRSFQSFVMATWFFAELQRLRVVPIE